MLPLFALVGALIVGVGLVSRRLARTPLTAPMIVVLVGFATGDHGLGWVSLDIDDHAIHVLGELTLALVLFTDACRIDLGALRRELGLPARLLGIGLPLTIGAGTVVGKLLVPELAWAEAATLAAILAPTDAALGQAVVRLPAVPERVRQALNVESGLNDGIAVPVVLVFLSLASRSEEGQSVGEWALFAAQQVTLGPLAGVVVAGLCARAIGRAKRGGWMGETQYRLSGIGIAMLCFALAGAIGGNGLIAAFAGGMVLGRVQRRQGEPLFELMEAEGQLMTLLVFTIFGGAMLWPALQQARWQSVAYAAASLTIVRMVPVAIALWGTRVDRSTVLFLGWFGPRGLASILFVLLLLERGDSAHRSTIHSAAMLTIVASIFLHGATAAPLAKRYAGRLGEPTDAPEFSKVTSHPLPHRLQHHPPESI